MAAVLTIGHSNVAMGIFLERLAGHAVQVVVDVRSAPYSRHVPHFNKQPLARALAQAGYTYLFLGDRLGGRPDDPLLYDSAGRPDYERLSRRPDFQAGIDRLLKEVATGSRLLLVCGEDNPVTCHRHLLIGRHLELVHGLPVYHLRGDGSMTRCLALFQSRPRQLNLFQVGNRNP